MHAPRAGKVGDPLVVGETTAEKLDRAKGVCVRDEAHLPVLYFTHPHCLPWRCCRLPLSPAPDIVRVCEWPKQQHWARSLHI